MFKLLVVAITAYAVYQFFFGDNRDDRPPSRSQSPKLAQPPVRRPDERQYQQNIDSSQRDHTPFRPTTGRRPDERQYQQSINSSQKAYTPLEVYAALRAKAKREGDLKAQCSQQSQEAYQRRDRARAKVLSEEGKRHGLERDKLNAKASAIIFKGKLISILS